MPGKTEMQALIERYEAEHYPIPDTSPADVLRFLIEQNDLTQRDLAAELGSDMTVSWCSRAASVNA